MDSAVLRSAEVAEERVRLPVDARAGSVGVRLVHGQHRVLGVREEAVARNSAVIANTFANVR
jgi:hypothetical protein